MSNKKVIEMANGYRTVTKVKSRNRVKKIKLLQRYKMGDLTLGRYVRELSNLKRKNNVNS